MRNPVCRRLTKRMSACATSLALVGAVVFAGAPAEAESSALKWAPPSLSNPIQLTIVNGQQNLKLDDSRDYLLTISGQLRAAGGLSINGGRNVVLIGGEIITPPASVAPEPMQRRGLYLKNQRGTVHVEGLKIGGSDLAEGINLDQRHNNTVQLQNIKVDEVHGSYAGHHADVIQTWGGPRTLRVDRLDAATEYQGLFLLPSQHFKAAELADWQLRNVRIRSTSGAGYALWKQNGHEIGLENVNIGRATNAKSLLMWPNTAAWTGATYNSWNMGEMTTGSPGSGYASPGYSTGSWTPPVATPGPLPIDPTPADPDPESGVDGGSMVAAASSGYWLVGEDGGVFAFGKAGFHGSTGAMRLNRPIVGIAPTSSSNGYWLVASDGGVFAFGDARFHGSTGAMTLNQPVVGMATTKSGNGYWMVASDGGIFAFGDARFFGSTGAMRLNKPIVGMATTRSGNGYWLVASDGGVFAFGDARFHGSTGGITLNQPISGLATTPSGNGYWMVASDGGIFAFGDAGFHGAATGRLNGSAVSIQPTVSGAGYWINSNKGDVRSFGDASNFGAIKGTLNKQVVSSAVSTTMINY